jgi:tRNA pseudouridine55 synthase
MDHVTLADMRAAAEQFVGDIQQIPPMVSAVKVDGQRLHHLARQGKVVERQPRPVTVYRFDIDEVADEPGVFRATVECSSGTYIRTLAADIGQALGGGAHLRGLRRTAIGSYSIDEATPLNEVTVLDPREAMRDYPSVVVRDDVRAAVAHGQVLELDRLGVPAQVVPPRTAEGRPVVFEGARVDTDAGPWAVLDDVGTLLAVYARHRDHEAKPIVVISG